MVHPLPGTPSRNRLGHQLAQVSRRCRMAVRSHDVARRFYENGRRRACNMVFTLKRAVRILDDITLDSLMCESRYMVSDRVDTYHYDRHHIVG